MLARTTLSRHTTEHACSAPLADFWIQKSKSTFKSPNYWKSWTWLSFITSPFFFSLSHQHTVIIPRIKAFYSTSEATKPDCPASSRGTHTHFSSLLLCLRGGGKNWNERGQLRSLPFRTHFQLIIIRTLSCFPATVTRYAIQEESDWSVGSHQSGGAHVQACAGNVC